jgi:hypothetical protein
LPCLIRISNDLLTVPEQYERLTQTCLLTVNSFLTWVEYNHFEQYELFLCELFLKFFQLNSVKLRHASFECLLSLVNKRLARRQLQQQQQQRNKRIASLPSAALNCEQEKLFLNYLLGDNTLEMFYRLLISPTVSVFIQKIIEEGFFVKHELKGVLNCKSRNLDIPPSPPSLQTDVTDILATYCHRRDRHMRNSLLQT